jgi:hypothetical protein
MLNIRDFRIKMPNGALRKEAHKDAQKRSLFVNKLTTDFPG